MVRLNLFASPVRIQHLRQNERENIQRAQSHSKHHRWGVSFVSRGGVSSGLDLLRQEGKFSIRSPGKCGAQTEADAEWTGPLAVLTEST